MNTCWQLKDSKHNLVLLNEIFDTSCHVFYVGRDFTQLSSQWNIWYKCSCFVNGLEILLKVHQNVFLLRKYFLISTVFVVGQNRRETWWRQLITQINLFAFGFLFVNLPGARLVTLFSRKMHFELFSGLILVATKEMFLAMWLNWVPENRSKQT